MNIEKIPFRVNRDFGETFNTSLKFLRQNLKLFLQCLVFIAGPFILLSSIAAAYYMATLNQNISSSSSVYERLFEQYNNPAYYISAILRAISNLALIGTVYAFMICYYEKGPNNFTIIDVRKVLAKNIGHIIGTFFTLLLYIGLALIALVGVGFIFGSISVGLGVLYIFLIFIGLLLIGPPIMWVISSVYLIKMHEGGNAFFAFGRAREVMKNNFWWTWVIIACAFIALMLVAAIFGLPQTIYYFILNMHEYQDAELSIPFMIVSTVCTFCITLIYSVIYIICGFHYYSLAEKKEGKGMFERINEIGNKPVNDVEQHY